MNPLENPEETIPVEFSLTEDYMETSESESLEMFEQETPEEIMSLIFPEDQRIYVTLYAYASRVSGKLAIKVITDHVTPEFTGAGLKEYEISSSWTIPTASQMDAYREECSEYNRQSGGMLTNNLMIRDMIVAHHLKELLLPPSSKPFSFKYARPDRLSRDSIRQLKLMHSGIYDRLYTEFVSESCLVV